MGTIVKPLLMESGTINTDEFAKIIGGIGGSGMNPRTPKKGGVWPIGMKKPDVQLLSNIVEFDVLTQGYSTSGATKIASGITDSISGTSRGFYPYNMSLFTGKTIDFLFTGNTQFLTWNGITANTKNIFTYQLYKYNKNYVDPKLNYDVKIKSKSLLHPLQSSIKQDVRVSTISNINIDAVGSGDAAFDGVTLSVGDRVLVRSQTTFSQNGIYIANSGAGLFLLKRALDWDETSDIIEGAEIFVKAGNTYASTTQRLVSTPPYELDNSNFPIKFSSTTVTSFSAVSSDRQAYVVDGIEGKELRFYRNNKYTFNIDAVEHPFYISKSMFGMGLSAITSGVSVSHTKFGHDSFVEKGKVEFTPNVTTPDTVYYASELDSNMGGKINIYTGAFVPLVYEKTLAHSGFTGNSPTLTDSIINSIFEDKGEYIIKGGFGFTASTLTGKTLSFEDKNETLKNRGTYNLYEDFTLNKYEKQYKGFVDYFYDISILSGLTGITVGGQPLINTNLPYRIYDKTYDNYFVTLTNPDEPVFNFADLSSGSTFQYISEDFTIGSGGQSRFILTHVPVGDVQVNVNGLSIKETDEWSGASLNSTLADNRIVDLVDKIYKESGDTINVTYLRGTFLSQPFHLQQHKITGITSGATGSQSAIDIVYFNTTESKYEFYLDIEPKEAESVSIILNGAKLSSGIDFALSNTNKQRIIFLTDVTLAVNDIVLAYYLKPSQTLSGVTGTTITRGSIKTRTPKIEWLVPPPVDDSGKFIVDLVASTNTGYTFTNNIHYSATTKYSGGVSNYFVTMPTITGNDETFIYRVVNEKHFTTIKEDVLSAKTVSRNVKIDTKDKIINQY